MNYRELNFQVMTDTVEQYETNSVLQEAIKNTVSKQKVIYEGTDLGHCDVQESRTQYVLSGKRSFEAAKAYAGKHVAVLNYANNHSIGGAPFSAGAQEESLCRCSTLFPCLQQEWETFYKPHIERFRSGEMGAMGNDDLIYVPDVVVFKSDESAPQTLPVDEWYHVDIITCAAPECFALDALPDNYDEIIARRLKLVLDAAEAEKVEVLVLGAWGCGAFKNPTYRVARAFCKLLKGYNFEIVEFAIGDKYSNKFIAFDNEMKKAGLK